MTQYLNCGLDLEQALLGRGELIAAGQVVTGNRLGMTAEERPARVKWLAEEIVSANGPRGTKGTQGWLIVCGDGNGLLLL